MHLSLGRARSGLAGVLAAGVLITAAACSTGSAPSTATGTGATGTLVTVTESEYTLKLSRSQFAPGTYTFVAQNAGTIGHALAIAGPGVSGMRTAVISPGDKAQLTVRLQAGGYELWCPVDGHKGLGMDTHIQVAGTTGTATSASATGSGGGSGG